jgi:signal transduction histidine kinase
VSKGHNKLGYVHRVPGGDSDYTKAAEASILPRNQVEAADLQGDTDKVRRFRATGKVGPISRKPHVAALLGSAYVTLWEELNRLERVALARPLEDMELRRYSKLVEALSRLAKEEREQQRHEKLEDIDLEELLEAAEEARKLLKESNQ